MRTLESSRERITSFWCCVIVCIVSCFGQPASAAVTNLPTTLTGGTVSDIYYNDTSAHAVAKGGTLDVGGFSTFGGSITSVYLFVEWAVEDGYDGTNALQLNGVNTSIVPADGDGARHTFIDVTGGSFGIDTSGEITNSSVTFFNSDGASGQSVHFDYIYLVINPELPIHLPPTWSDEFEGANGTPADPAIWTYEVGYQRNNEDQYYQDGSTNGWHENGEFIIEAREETVDAYNYTSASIRSINNYSWMYGRAQIRAKIPATAGMWPAIWQVGDVGDWPHNGECDIMEYYGEKILANCAVGNGGHWVAKWDAANRTMATLEAVDPNWRNEYHIWTMQWDESAVRLYVDNILINTINQSWLVNNGSWGGSPSEPFKQPHNIWLNLALGGNNGGNPAAATYPQRYYIDYWRVWEGDTDNVAPTDIALSSNVVNEGLPVGTVVGNLSATDPDPAEVIRYTLVSGAGDTNNADFDIPEFVSDSTTAGWLKTAAVLDYDDGATRSIRVRATDIEGATYDEIFTITVIPDPAIVVSTSTLSVDEGSSNTFDVKLRMLPASNVTVNVSRTAGDADLSVAGGSSLTFTTANGTNWQTVTIAAAQDADGIHGSATITCTDLGAVYTDATVDVTEIDDDNLQPSVNAGTNQTIYLVGGGGASPVAGETIFLDAGLDDGVNNVWEDSQTNWSPTIDGPVTWVEDAGSMWPGITAAYEFPGGTTGGEGCEGASLQDQGADQSPITLEIWFKPDVSASYPSNGQILWETGGGTGLGIFYRDGFVEAAHDSNQGELSTNVSALIGDFIQVVVTYDPTTSTDNFNLYINGELKLTSSRSDPDMCASDAAGLGTRGASNTGGAGTGTANAESFDGKIAIFRAYHNQIVDAAGVSDNFNSIAAGVATAPLDATVSDPESDPFTTSWTKTGGPAAAASFANSSAVDTDAYFTETGVYTLRLTADDGMRQPFDEVDITVALPPLTVDIAAAQISENGGSTTGTVTRMFTDGDLVVTLSSSDTGEATVPATVTIVDGQAISPSFAINAVDDALSDGLQTVTITATATNHQDGIETLDVTDDEFAGPATPTDLIATATSTNQIELNWTDNSTNETGFLVERSGTSGSNFTAVGTATMNSTNHTDTGASPGYTYYYRVSATNATESGTPSAEAWATALKLSATVTLGNLAHTYDGNSCTATVSTVPAGLAYDIAYNGGAALPTNVGSYSVAAAINEASYQGTTNGTLVVSKGNPSVSLWPNSTSIEDGQALSNSVLTGGSASAGGNFAFETPSQTPSIGTNAVSVIFFPTDSANYNNVTGTVDVIVTAALIPATVTLSNTNQTHTGSGLSVTVTTAPTGLAVSVTYDGTSLLPTSVGVYAVTGTVVEAGYKGSTNGTLIISKATPTVDTWPTTTNAIVVGQAVSNAPLAGGSASVPGSFSYDTPTATPGVGSNAVDVIFTPTDGANYNNATGTVDVTVLPLPPSAPTGLIAVGSPGQVDLAWQASAGATSYKINRSTTPGGPYSVVGAPTATNYIDSVSNGQIWRYVVSAVNAGGESLNSSEASATLPHTLPFFEDFEGLSDADWDGQNLWAATNAAVQTNLMLETKAGSITSETGYARQDFAGTDADVWADMEIQPVFCANDMTPAFADATASMYFNTNGNPVVYDGTNILTCSGKVVTTGSWVRVTIHSDYTAKTWDLYIDTDLVASNLGFYSEAAATFETLDVRGGAADVMAVDNIGVTVDSPFSQHSLTVVSGHGVAVPSGVKMYGDNASVDSVMTTLTVLDANTNIQYVCTGWAATGSAPASGSTTNMSFTITNDTVIMWQWITNYWVDFTVIGN